MNYQVYISDREGHFIVQIECPNDINAAAAAQHLMEANEGVEFWQFNHKIGQFDRPPDAVR